MAYDTILIRVDFFKRRGIYCRHVLPFTGQYTRRPYHSLINNRCVYYFNIVRRKLWRLWGKKKKLPYSKINLDCFHVVVVVVLLRFSYFAYARHSHGWLEKHKQKKLEEKKNNTKFVLWKNIRWIESRLVIRQRRRLRL